MTDGEKERVFRGNRLLGALTEEEIDRLRPHLEVIYLKNREPLIEADRTIESVYFPADCVASLVSEMQDGQIVEVGTIGREGMAGLPVFLGRDTVPLATFCQVPGKAARMSAHVLKNEVKPGDRLHHLLRRYTEATFVFAAQTSACNRLHSVRQRASRWLLHTQDRMNHDGFEITQEFLAEMLGVRRASVSEVASSLQREGMISYSRGNVKVTDRPGLKSAACECYWVIAGEFDHILA